MIIRLEYEDRGKAALDRPVAEAQSKEVVRAIESDCEYHENPEEP
jgi:hypothetical protein